MNEKQTPPPPTGGQLQTHEPVEKMQPGNLGTQKKPALDDNEEDPVLNEGYLPEIYFSPQRENPADW